MYSFLRMEPYCLEFAIARVLIPGGFNLTNRLSRQAFLLTHA
jgi:hypothetical protein